MTIVKKEKSLSNTVTSSKRTIEFKNLNTNNKEIRKLKLTVNRLEEIESDLITDLSLHPMKTSTGKLLAELRIYTNRISKQLQELTKE